MKKREKQVAISRRHGRQGKNKRPVATGILMRRPSHSAISPTDTRTATHGGKAVAMTPDLFVS